jgi:hypothetical protein
MMPLSLAQQHGCSHSTAICTLEFDFTVEEASERKTNERRTRRTNKVPHIDAGSHFIRFDFDPPSITLTMQLQSNLQPLPCKPPKNYVSQIAWKMRPYWIYWHNIAFKLPNAAQHWRSIGPAAPLLILVLSSFQTVHE